MIMIDLQWNFCTTCTFNLYKIIYINSNKKGKKEVEREKVDIEWLLQ